MGTNKMKITLNLNNIIFYYYFLRKRIIFFFNAKIILKILGSESVCKKNIKTFFLLINKFLLIFNNFLFQKVYIKNCFILLFEKFCRKKLFFIKF